MEIDNNEECNKKGLIYTVIVLSFIIAVSIGYIFYLANVSNIKLKADISKNYIKKDKIKFSDLPLEQQNKYIAVSTDKTTHKEVKKEAIINNKEKNFSRISCYDMSDGRYVSTKECAKNVKIFMEENKNSKRFEVIGVVDDTDFVMIDKLDKNTYKSRLSHLYELAQIGLAKKRAIEAVWLIKKYLNYDADIKVSNYKITSKDKKGFIIKAYH